MKVLMFTVSHANLEELMAMKAIARLHDVKDLGRQRDHYVIKALIREEYLDTIIEKSADRPRWIKWPEG